MRLKVLACAAAMLLSTAAAAGDEAAWPSWMAGAWSLTGEAASWTEEFWTHPRGGIMIGASREGSGETLRSWESIRIVRQPDGSLAYIPMPNGGAPITFAMVKQDARSIEFANADHDYPQRIRYWREGDRLNAEISLLDGSRSVRWSYGSGAE